MRPTEKQRFIIRRTTRASLQFGKNPEESKTPGVRWAGRESVWEMGMGGLFFGFFHVVEHVLNVFIFFELVEELFDGCALLFCHFLEVVGDAFKL